MSESVDGFPFERGDFVRVRVREHGTSGNIVAKFEAECIGISDRGGLSSQWARFDLPWGNMKTALRPYEAEFEAIADD